MTKLAYREDLLGFDLVFGDDGSFVIDDGLETPVVVSLFTDAPATVEELRLAGLPEDDRRGYFGDAYPDVEGDVTGSKLWLLERAKLDDATLADARRYAEEALAWMVVDGAVSAVEVVPLTQVDERSGIEVLALGVTLYRHEDAAPAYQGAYAVTTGATP